MTNIYMTKPKECRLCGDCAIVNFPETDIN